MSIAVELPSLGESVFEGTVARWLVSEGEMVEVDQPIVEVTTDKVDAEIPAPTAGVIEEILVAEGDVIEVGTVLARIDPDRKPAATPKVSEPASVPPAAAPVSNPPRSGESIGTAVPATPVARRVAEDASIDLRNVRGTGSAGRVTKDDVLRHQEGDAPSPAAALAPSAPQTVAVAQPTTQTQTSPRAAVRPSPGFGYELQPGDRVIPMTPMRRIISDHMVYSKRTSPHVGTVAEVDLSRIVKLRNQHKKAFQQNYGTSLTFLPFIVHATVRALREFPALNASVVEDSIIEKQDIHLGVATETEKGLVVPVVRNADRLSMSGLVMAIDDLASRARNKKLSADDLRGGTFTVSNPGRQGNLYGFAIINQPQVGILRMGEISKRAVVRTLDGEDAIVIRTMMYLALSYDHRAVDGAPANGFLHRIGELLEAAEFDL
jgi:2-oxoglutarate dehydrogenase E2 component (dihydrolipoamide succinyltransferase)